MTQVDGEECIHGLMTGTCALCKPRTATATRSSRLGTGEVSGRKTPANSADYFGHPWPEWYEIRDVAREHILRCAHRGSTVAYGELWSAVETQLGKSFGNAWRQLPNLLGQISEDFYAETGLMLTAIVVRDTGDENPGEGFFREAAKLGALPVDDAPPVGVPWLGMTKSQREFWERQVRLFREHRTPPPQQPVDS